jgi:hypothetical protein
VAPFLARAVRLEATKERALDVWERWMQREGEGGSGGVEESVEEALLEALLSLAVQHPAQAFRRRCFAAWTAHVRGGDLLAALRRVALLRRLAGRVADPHGLAAILDHVRWLWARAWASEHAGAGVQRSADDAVRCFVEDACNAVFPGFLAPPTRDEDEEGGGDKDEGRDKEDGGLVRAATAHVAFCSLVRLVLARRSAGSGTEGAGKARDESAVLSRDLLERYLRPLRTSLRALLVEEGVVPGPAFADPSHPLLPASIAVVPRADVRIARASLVPATDAAHLRLLSSAVQGLEDALRPAAD